MSTVTLTVEGFVEGASNEDQSPGERFALEMELCTSSFPPSLPSCVLASPTSLANCRTESVLGEWGNRLGNGAADCEEMGMSGGAWLEP